MLSLANSYAFSKTIRKRARLAYVIGNSKFYDQPLPSDDLLAAIFGHLGFELERIEKPG